MKPLTYSDNINIEAFKQLIRCLGNDIEDAKASKAANTEKIISIFKLSQQRADLVLNASRSYPQIKWTEFVVNCKVKIDREVMYGVIANSKNFN